MAIKLDKTKLVKNLVNKNKLVQHIDQALATDFDEFIFEYTPKKSDYGWHPSGDCLPAPTALYAIAQDRIAGNKESISIDLRKTFMVGHFWHQYIQAAVVRAGLATPEAIERVGYKAFSHNGAGHFTFATGQGDIAPCRVPGHGDYVVDIKTMSKQQYNQASVPEWAANKYKAQINIYMDFFDIDQGIILAVCKDSPHDMKEFEYERDQALIDAIYDKWKFVSECLENNTPPSTLDDDHFVLPL